MKLKLAAAHQLSFSKPVMLCNCLGVLQLAASLSKKCIPCEVVDLQEFSYLYRCDFNRVIEAVAGKILSPLTDLVGLSTMATHLAVAVEICKRVKEKSPQTVTVLGGPGVSFPAFDVLNCFPFVDMAMRGEADEAFPQLVEALIARKPVSDWGCIPGLVYRYQGKIVDNGWPAPVADLDKLPLPAYTNNHIYNPNNQKLWEGRGNLFSKRFPGRKQNFEEDSTGDYDGISIEAGRGCPYNCTFCSTSAFFSKKHRLKSVQRIIDEIVYSRRCLGDRRVIFHHDLMTLDHVFVEELCKEISRQVPGLVWKCHSRFDTVDEPLLEKMRLAGCNEIFFGIEAASPRMQEVIRKRLDLSGFDEKLAVLKRLGFSFSLSFIVGVPGEELPDIRAILDMALLAKSLCGDHAVIKIHTLVPLSGSELVEQWKDRLVFDETGSPGTTHIPQHWGELLENIKKYPRIFPVYYHFPVGEEKRVRSLAFAMIGVCINSYMKSSLQFAYSRMGASLADVFTANIDRIPLPSPAVDMEQFGPLFEMIRVLVLEHWCEGSVEALRFDALSRFEIAAKEVWVRRDPGFSRVVESYFDPNRLVEELDSRFPGISDENPGEKRYFVVIWDEKESKVRYTPLRGVLL